jgi:predicted metal-dependent hydrolase
MPEDDRRAAFEAGLAAYERGDFFLAHELLEPAWMGTADLAERDLYQGLIKLAAGFVHAARGNPTGVATNIRGARERLARVPPAEAERQGIALGPLLRQLDTAIAIAERPTDAVPHPALVMSPPALRGGRT